MRLIGERILAWLNYLPGLAGKLEFLREISTGIRTIVSAIMILLHNMLFF
jgi:hypothetical protein